MGFRNIAAIRERIHSLLEGCKCSTGCTSRRCGCKRKGKICSISCQCLNCLHLDNVTALPQNEINEQAQVALCEDVDAGQFWDRTECDDIMDWVFAEEEFSSSNSDTESEPEVS